MMDVAAISTSPGRPTSMGRVFFSYDDLHPIVIPILYFITTSSMSVAVSVGYLVIESCPDHQASAGDRPRWSLHLPVDEVDSRFDNIAEY